MIFHYSYHHHLRKSIFILSTNLKYDDLANYVSYFETEVYPFAIVYEMNDGSFSEAFPIKGFDSIKAIPNDYGRVRFPKRTNDTNVLYKNGKSRLFNISFNLTTFRDAARKSYYDKLLRQQQEQRDADADQLAQHSATGGSE
jgi:hypothetical protein